jgi:hypothetical protein
MEATDRIEVAGPGGCLSARRMAANLSPLSTPSGLAQTRPREERVWGWQ